MGHIPVLALLSSCCLCRDAAGAEQSARQAAQALMPHRLSRVLGTRDGALPFTPLCVPPDFALALMSACSLDPMLAARAPMAAVPVVLGRTRLRGDR